MQTVKCVIVGDGAVGKTSLVMSSVTGDFVANVPDVADEYRIPEKWNGNPLHLNLVDSAVGQYYGRLRCLNYPHTDVFLVAFSLVNPASFENVKLKWQLEVSHYCPGVPIVLVGTKLDLRQDAGTIDCLAERQLGPITHQQGEQMMKDIGAVGYMECSALTQEGLWAVFSEAIRAVFMPSQPKKGGGGGKKSCLLL